jgi:hypothetical protein
MRTHRTHEPGTDRETAMTRNTLALAYAAKTSKTASAQSQPAPRAMPLPPAAPTAPRPAAARPEQAIIEDALLIAVRRSLASCRDSTQLRMLAAFEATR